jgi:dTDP-4-dehydrorhamnose 3,5-epimerase-like enzyme
MDLELKLHLPQLIDLGKVGDSSLGYLTFAEDLPFKIVRTYWTYYAPHEVIRGHHAHRELHQLIVALSGTIEFNIENAKREEFSFILDQPNIGLYIPPLCWRTIKFSHNAVLLCLASMKYSEDDYIRSYEDFKKITWS